MIYSVLCYFRSQGSALSQKQMFGSNPDSPYIKFPPKFCLGRLINDSCPVPAGLSAVVYKINPLVSLKLKGPSKNDVTLFCTLWISVLPHWFLSSQNPCNKKSFIDDSKAMVREQLVLKTHSNDLSVFVSVRCCHMWQACWRHLHHWPEHVFEGQSGLDVASIF